ncbi:MAG: T9SS type A sorting domain-containing protein [Saprospiraceae bacterium]
MKKNLLFIFLVLLSSGMYAQMLSFSMDSLHTTGETTEFDIVGHATIENTTSGELLLKWDRIRNDLESGWESAICDKNNCYASTVNSNVNPGSNPNIPVVLAAGETSIIDVHVYANGIPGEGHIDVCLFTTDNTRDAIGCMTYTFAVGTVSTEEVTKENLQIFPNPTSDYFKLKNTNGVSRINLINMLGRSIRTYDVAPGKNYYIGDMPAGMYLASIIGKNGEVIKTTRVIKRYIAP